MDLTRAEAHALLTWLFHAPGPLTLSRHETGAEWRLHDAEGIGYLGNTLVEVLRLARQGAEEDEDDGRTTGHDESEGDPL